MDITKKIHRSWDFLRSYLYTDEMKELKDELLPNQSFKPDKQDIFNVFQMPRDKINVVVLGQDPYPGGKHACGYSFASRCKKLPSSLKIIRKEIQDEGFDTDRKAWQYLKDWRDQGVFLLNTSLTVEAGSNRSHMKYWREFINRAITVISNKNPCIWLIWGRDAKEMSKNIAGKKTTLNANKAIDPDNIRPGVNYILRAAHPNAENYKKDAGFYGCNHFRAANEILKITKNTKINW